MGFSGAVVHSVSAFLSVCFWSFFACCHRCAFDLKACLSLFIACIQSFLLQRSPTLSQIKLLVFVNIALGLLLTWLKIQHLLDEEAKPVILCLHFKRDMKTDFLSFQCRAFIQKHKHEIKIYSHFLINLTLNFMEPKHLKPNVEIFFKFKADEKGKSSFDFWSFIFLPSKFICKIVLLRFDWNSSFVWKLSAK